MEEEAVEEDVKAAEEEDDVFAARAFANAADVAAEVSNITDANIANEPRWALWVVGRGVELLDIWVGLDEVGASVGAGGCVVMFVAAAVWLDSEVERVEMRCSTSFFL